MVCEEMIVKSFYYRKARFGGFSKTIVVIDGKVVLPSRERRSGTGRHGEDYYLLSREQWNRAILLHFSQSNRGHRNLVVESALQLPEKLTEKLKMLWVSGFDMNDVVSILIRELKQLKKQQSIDEMRGGT